MTRSARIAAVRRDERKKDVSQMFNISRNTLELWLKREAESGDCQAITHDQQGVGIKSQIGKGFVSLSKSMGGTRKEKWLSLWGDNVTPQNLSDAVGKMGWSRTKRLTATKKGMTSSAKHFKSN